MVAITTTTTTFTPTKYILRNIVATQALILKNKLEKRIKNRLLGNDLYKEYDNHLLFYE